MNIKDQDSIDECLSNFGKEEELDYIVVSDGEEVSYMIPTKQSRHAMLNLCL